MRAGAGVPETGAETGEEYRLDCSLVLTTSSGQVTAAPTVPARLGSDSREERYNE